MTAAEARKISLSQSNQLVNVAQDRGIALVDRFITPAIKKALSENKIEVTVTFAEMGYPFYENEHYLEYTVTNNMYREIARRGFNVQTENYPKRIVLTWV